MLIIFKSPAGGDVIMFEKNGKEMLSVLGKDPEEPKGIFTVAQQPEAIATLKAAIAADKARAPADDEDESERKPGGGNVSFFQRAVPLLELLELSLKEGKPVTWGV